MKKLTALLVLMLTMVLSILPAQAEVERSKLLDAAFSMLEEGNDFVHRYNEMTVLPRAAVQQARNLGADPLL